MMKKRLLVISALLVCVSGFKLTTNASDSRPVARYYLVDGIDASLRNKYVGMNPGQTSRSSTNGVYWDEDEQCAVFDGESWLELDNPLEGCTVDTGFTISLEAYISSENDTNGTYYPVYSPNTQVTKGGWQRMFEMCGPEDEQATTSKSQITKKYSSHRFYFNAGICNTGTGEKVYNHTQIGTSIKFSSTYSRIAVRKDDSTNKRYMDKWHTYTIKVIPETNNGSTIAVFELYIDGQKIEENAYYEGTTRKDGVRGTTVEAEVLSKVGSGTCYIGTDYYEVVGHNTDGLFYGKIRNLSFTPSCDSYILTYNREAGVTSATGSSLVSSVVSTLPKSFPKAQRDGYAFCGWYTDAACTKKAVPETVILRDTTLYAKWLSCTDSDNTLEVTGSDNQKYTVGISNVNIENNEVKVDIDGVDELNHAEGSHYSTDDIVYYMSDGVTHTTKSNSGASVEGGAPKKAGTYKATLTIGGITLSHTFIISEDLTGKLVSKTNTSGSVHGAEIEKIATEEEKAAMDAGTDLYVWISSNENTPSIATSTAMTTKAQAIGKAIGKYLDISMYKKLSTQNDSEKSKISDTDSDVTVTISLPRELINTEVKRNYSVIRYHDNVADELPTSYDNVDNTLTFQTNKFSDYAIAYADILIPKVTFVANGGRGEMSPVSVEEELYSLPDCLFLPPLNKEFVCWSYTQNGTKKIEQSQITVSDNIILYAIWKEHDHHFSIKTISSGITRKKCNCGYYIITFN